MERSGVTAEEGWKGTSLATLANPGPRDTAVVGTIRTTGASVGGTARNVFGIVECDPRIAAERTAMGGGAGIGAPAIFDAIAPRTGAASTPLITRSRNSTARSEQLAREARAPAGRRAVDPIRKCVGVAGSPSLHLKGLPHLRGQDARRHVAALAQRADIDRDPRPGDHQILRKEPP